MRERAAGHDHIRTEIWGGRGFIDRIGTGSVPGISACGVARSVDGGDDCGPGDVARIFVSWRVDVEICNRRTTVVPRDIFLELWRSVVKYIVLLHECAW